MSATELPSIYSIRCPACGGVLAQESAMGCRAEMHGYIPMQYRAESKYQQPSAQRSAEGAHINEKEQVAEVFRQCAGCGDDIWPGEPAGELCVVCNVKSAQRRAPSEGDPK